MGQHARLIQEREKQNEKCTKSEKTGREAGTQDKEKVLLNAEAETRVNAMGWSCLLQKGETKPDTVGHAWNSNTEFWASLGYTAKACLKEREETLNLTAILGTEYIFSKTGVDEKRGKDTGRNLAEKQRRVKE